MYFVRYYGDVIVLMWVCRRKGRDVLNNTSKSTDSKGWEPLLWAVSHETFFQVNLPGTISRLNEIQIGAQAKHKLRRGRKALLVLLTTSHDYSAGQTQPAGSLSPCWVHEFRLGSQTELAFSPAFHVMWEAFNRPGRRSPFASWLLHSYTISILCKTLH